MITLELDRTEVAQLLTCLDVVRHQVEAGRAFTEHPGHQREVANAIEKLWMKVGDAAASQEGELDQ